MKAELDDYEKVEMVERFRRLQTPQLWKSRFRMVPLVLLLGLVQVIIFLLMFLYFRHKSK
jgi:hypothetical protein